MIFFRHWWMGLLRGNDYFSKFNHKKLTQLNLDYYVPSFLSRITKRILFFILSVMLYLSSWLSNSFPWNMKILLNDFFLGGGVLKELCFFYTASVFRRENLDCLLCSMELKLIVTQCNDFFSIWWCPIF